MVLGTALSAFGAERAAQGGVANVPQSAINNIGRYCTTCWRNARLPVDSWGDCTQEVFCRLLERVPGDSWERALSSEGEERREFLRAIDAVKKRTQRARKWTSGLEGVADVRDAQTILAREEREAVQRAAAELLSDRQQRILQMTFEGWSVQEMAEALQVTPERISDEKYKAIRKLRDHLADRDV
jgi:RNA polymerase sigma factor (sigma-70 family)